MMRKNFIQRMRMPLPELEQYYRERRKDRFENNGPFCGVKLRKALHPVLVWGLKIMHLISGQKITVIGDKRIPTGRPVIFAATHIGWNDIEMIFTAVGTHAYLFWGDPRESYRTMDGFLLDLNGTIICDTDNKNDRYFGKENCVRWLKQGGNLLIFPEGAWNTTESLPTMPLYTGTAEMAIRSGAEIVPVAIEQYGKHYTVNIGENIRCSQMELAQKCNLTAALRDAMATLRWEIWSSHPQTKRAEIPPDYRQQELQRIQDQMNGVFTLDDIEKTRFHTKEEREQNETVACLEKLILCKENAFLFRNNKLQKNAYALHSNCSHISC